MCVCVCVCIDLLASTASGMLLYCVSFDSDELSIMLSLIHTFIYVPIPPPLPHPPPPPQITGRTPLHWASLYGRREVVELFCQKGCDVTVLDAEGRSPVHLAASSETTEALQALNKSFGNSIFEVVRCGHL